MKITMLIENEKCRENSSLKHEHGLSLLIEKENECILFDAGLTDSFLGNAEKLGLDLGKVTRVVLSHAHSDHAGGLTSFLKLNRNAKVYMSANAKQKLYVRLIVRKEDVSVSEELFQKYSDRIVFVDEFINIMDGVSIVPRIDSKPYPVGKSAKKLLAKVEGRYIQDSFNHEIAMVINNSGKLVIFAGCSHNGIVNIVDSIVRYFPGVPVQSVIGGFHLMGIPFGSLLGESREYIEGLGRKMNSYNIEKTYTAHCTGLKAYKILRDIMGDKIEYMSTGMQIEL